jgi:hypothetical protein
MTNLRRSEITYPIISGVVDQPEAPTNLRGGNGADLVARYNRLIDAIAPKILIDFSSADSDLGVTLSEYHFLILPVPYSLYAANPNNTRSEVLYSAATANFDNSQAIEPVTFAGLNSIFTIGLLAGGGYGGGSPLDDSYWEALEIEGRASFIDLPTVYNYNSDLTWNNLVGIMPLETSLKIKLRPSLNKPTVNQLVDCSF